MRGIKETQRSFVSFVVHLVVVFILLTHENDVQKVENTNTPAAEWQCLLVRQLSSRLFLIPAPSRR